MHDPEENEHDYSPPKSRWTRFFGFFLALVFVGYFGWFLFGQLRSYLSERMLAKAATFIGDGRTKDAMLCIKSSLRLDYGNLSSWHKLAKLYAGQEDYAGALDTYLKMFQTAYNFGKMQQLPQLFSREDQRTLVLVALRQGDQNLLNSIKDGMARVAGNKALSQLIIADAISKTGDMKSAAQALSAHSSADSIFTVPWKLSDLLEGKISSQLNPEEYFEVLVETEKRLGPIGYEVVFYGLKNSLVPVNRLFEWASALHNNKHAPARMRLLASKMLALISGAPVALESIIPANPAEMTSEDRVLLGLEFMKLGSPEKVLSLFDKTNAFESSEALKLWLAALLAMDRRSEVIAALGQASSPISTKVKALETLKVLRKSGNEAEVLFLLDAITIDPQNKDDLVAFADFLAETRQEDLLAKLLSLFPNNSPERASLVRILIAKARERGDLQSVINLKNSILEAIKPLKSTRISADREIFIGMAGGKTDLMKTESLLSGKRDSATVWVSHAFALLNSGQKSAALEVLRKVAPIIDVHALEIHQKVAVASILAANNLYGPASEVARLAMSEDLFPAEAEKLSAALRPVTQHENRAGGKTNQP